MSIKAFLLANWLKAASFALAALSVAAVLLGARQSGKNAERASMLSRKAKIVRESHEIEDENRRSLADGDANQRLLSDWARD